MKKLFIFAVALVGAMCVFNSCTMISDAIDYDPLESLERHSVTFKQDENLTITWEFLHDNEDGRYPYGEDTEKWREEDLQRHIERCEMHGRRNNISWVYDSQNSNYVNDYFFHFFPILSDYKPVFSSKDIIPIGNNVNLLDYVKFKIQVYDNDKRELVFVDTDIKGKMYPTNFTITYSAPNSVTAECTMVFENVSYEFDSGQQKITINGTIEYEIWHDYHCTYAEDGTVLHTDNPFPITEEY